MDEAEMAGGMAAADLDLADHACACRFSPDFGADGVAVGTVLAQFDLQPVAHRPARPASGCAGIAEQACRRFAIDDEQVEHAIGMLKSSTDRAAAARGEVDAGLFAGFGEPPSGLPSSMLSGS